MLRFLPPRRWRGFAEAHCCAVPDLCCALRHKAEKLSEKSARGFLVGLTKVGTAAIIGEFSHWLRAATALGGG